LGLTIITSKAAYASLWDPIREKNFAIAKRASRTSVSP
jgi:hypothetical protein